MLLFSKIKMLDMESTFTYTFPLNPLKPSMSSKTIVARHPVEHVVAPPITWSPRAIETVADDVEVDSRAVHCAQTLKGRTKDIGSGEKDSTSPSKVCSDHHGSLIRVIPITLPLAWRKREIRTRLRVVWQLPHP